MPISIAASVGEGGVNDPKDLSIVQSLFNKFRTPKLKEDTRCSQKILDEIKKLKDPLKIRDLKCWPETIKAIKEFQKGFLPKPDGRVDPGGKTWKKLVAAGGELGQGRSLLLTFDDGPTGDAPTPETPLIDILNTLQKNSIKAEFYVRGDKVKSYPNAAKMIVDRGHRIQNHSWSHPNLAKAQEKDVMSELKDTQDIIKEKTGVTPTKIRPPYGAGGWPKKYDPELAKVAQKLKLAIQNWDIDTNDWAQPAGIKGKKLEEIEEQFWWPSNKGKTSLIVLMHVKSETARDLPDFISQLKKWGFTFAQPN